MKVYSGCIYRENRVSWKKDILMRGFYMSLVRESLGFVMALARGNGFPLTNELNRMRDLSG